ncbi:hypothetical protein [Alteromonas sp. H39]|uniref:hypothetical protein n=1 Tax=Alteromonas sp. H39 TaxID=3389876 RepID=UPI0039E1A0E5
MQLIKSATVVALVTVILLATSHSDSLLGFISTAQASSVENSRTDVIMKMERLVEETDFNLADRDQFLRKQRIEHYLEQARRFDAHEWYFNRDDALARASNILSHHERMQSSTYASL